MTQVLTFSQALDWIKLHLDIVDVVGRTVQLKRAGRNLMGLCPFHAEKSPSFTVSHEKQMFKCFGCGEGGDSLTFLMKIDNKSFGEVIADLAEENDIEILRDGKAPNPQGKAEREKLIELHHKAAVYYRDMLMATAMPQDYLKERGLPAQIQSQFGIGYAPPGWRHLEETLKLRHPELKVTPKNLEKIGLLISKEESGNHYDRFRNRLMVPIHDEKGNVVAFRARALDPADEPKYLNSPETELYVKHRILFGLHLAKSVIRESGAAIVMEGYFDVMSAHMAGLRQAVGVCGTALTTDHLKLLSRAGAKTVYLCFDTDKAGQNATTKTLETLQPIASQQNLALKVVTLPIGKDPDEFFRSDNADIVSELFKDLMAEAKDGWTHQFDTQLAAIESPHTMESRIQAANNIMPILQRIEKPVLQHEWIRNSQNELELPKKAST